MIPTVDGYRYAKVSVGPSSFHENRRIMRNQEAKIVATDKLSFMMLFIVFFWFIHLFKSMCMRITFYLVLLFAETSDQNFDESCFMAIDKLLSMMLFVVFFDSNSVVTCGCIRET